MCVMQMQLVVKLSCVNFINFIVNNQTRYQLCSHWRTFDALFDFAFLCYLLSMFTALTVYQSKKESVIISY